MKGYLIMARPLPKESDTDHFNAKVPQALRDHLLACANAIQDDFIGNQGEAFGTPNINAIYSYHISGFIPSQLGGYEISELIRSDVDTSYHLTKAQSEAMTASEKYMYECFERDVIGESRRSTDPKLTKGWGYGDLDDYLEMQNKFSDYENDWFEPALLRCEMWIDESKGQERNRIGNDDVTAEAVFIRVSLNYMDQPYYRTGSDETLFEANFSVEAFLKATPETIVKFLEEKMKSVK
jgi:hypothetical protein